MVMLQTRWKRDRPSRVRLYVSVGMLTVLCIAVVVVARAVPSWLTRISAQLPKPAPVASAPPATTATTARFRPEIKNYYQLDRAVTVCGYSFDVPEGYFLDVMRQPPDVPRGGRFTGLRFRGPLGDAAQIRVMVVDYPKQATDGADAVGIEQRLEAALDRLFARLTRNATLVGLTRGEMTFGELNGIPFVQTGFAGDFRDEDKRGRFHRSGTAFVAIEANRDVFLCSLCEKSADREVRELLTASLLTLRKDNSAATSKAKNDG
jgi:hypothetical protein